MADTFRVLFVDDEPYLLELCKTYLERSGYFSVTTLSSAPAALELLKVEKFDAIISDYHMPDMDGIQFLDEVRARHGSVPFILFTGKGREEIVIQAINSGADFYLQKGGRAGVMFAELSNKIMYAVTRKRAEAALRESNVRFDQLAEQSGTITWEVDADGLYTYVSSVSEAVWGYPPEELVGRMYVFDLHPEPGREAFRKSCLATLARKKPFRDKESAVQAKDGRIVWVSTNGIPLLDADGSFWGYRGSDTNITGRREAEKALIKSEEQLSLAIEGSGVGLWDWHVLTGETSFNERWAGMLGYTLAELTPVSIKTWVSLCHPDDLARSDELLKLHFSGKLPIYEAETRMKHRDGHWVWVLDRGSVVEWDDAGQPARVTGTHLDITDRVRHEEEIVASLKQKESLLREVHHRVRNNMQVILSLLNLQAKKIRDEKFLKIFRENQNRVKAIALVHEELYQSKSLTLVDFRDYLRKLTENLVLTSDARKHQLTIEISAEKIYLPVDMVIPLGLITNELLTNSLKYAFPGHRKGKISIDVQKDHENYRYLFRDDGAGLPGDVVFDQGTDGNDLAETLGLQLVISMVEQIRGTVKLDRVNGAAFEIRLMHDSTGEYLLA